MKQHPTRMGVGASSILFILVILSLTLFAVLSFVQARSDAALTNRASQSVAAYYDAVARAQQAIAQIDDALVSGGQPTDVEGVSLQSEGVYTFSIGSVDGHALNVRVDVSSGACRVTSYRYESAAEWTGESTGTLWQGN